MKTFRTLIAGIIIGAMLMSAVTVFADSQAIEAFFNNIKISIDGNIVELRDTDGNPIEPFIHEGTTYLPVRAIAEALGMEVKFNETTNTVELTKVREGLILEELRELSPRATASILEQNPEVRDTIDENGYAIWKGKSVRLNKDYLDGKIKVNLAEEEITTVVEPNKKHSPITYTSDGIELIYKYNDAGEYIEDGKYYIDTYQIATKYENKFNYKTGLGFSTIELSDSNKVLRLYNFSLQDGTPLLDNIPNLKYKYIPLDYYEKYILPLFK
jgi:flagellar hook assembly protein FlgD